MARLLLVGLILWLLCLCCETFALPSSYLPNHSQTRQQRIEPLTNNLNLQTSMNNTSVTNTINSTQQQPSEDHNLSVNRTTPAYKDVTQQN
ncbi:unnamed protein product [Adineta ricciae]|uniref:Uncharacterized protein n=1 Tax=Adineta ricciae TaxID=249248 RepID=A0A815PTF9_ADIRI|nr:unnamed protein product [Adineta ricciae]